MLSATCKIHNGQQGHQKRLRGLERSSTIGYRNLCQPLLNRFFDSSIHSMRKVDNGEKRGGTGKK